MNRFASKIPKINLVEVGPRDGLQNESKILTVNQRVQFLHKLQESGFRNIEVGSFVNPKAVPQMADTAKVLQQCKKLPWVNFSVLVPNLKGWEAAGPKEKIDEVVFFMSATEGFNKRNLGCSIAKSKETYTALAPRVYDSGLAIRGSISCCWVCPFDGKTGSDDVLRVIDFYRTLGIKSIDIADTIGAAEPDEVANLFHLIRRTVGLDGIAGHFHDSNAKAIQNIDAAWNAGVHTFHSSISGIGGCPFSPNRVGNVATEKVLEHYKVEDINITRFKETKAWITEQLK